MAQYDLPAMVDYVLSATSSKSIGYVGHSEGTTQAFAALSMLPELNEKLNVFIALAPVAGIANQESRLLTLLADLDIAQIVKHFGAKEFLPETSFLKRIARLFCNGGIFTVFCEDVVFSLCGKDPLENHNLNRSRLDVMLTHTPSGTSTQNMVHWAQMAQRGGFFMYDFGAKENLIKYGQKTPPVYNLANINASIALFTGTDDDLADPADVEILRSGLSSANIVYFNNQPDFDHLDFTWGIDCHTVIYPDVVRLLKTAAFSA